MKNFLYNIILLFVHEVVCPCPFFGTFLLAGYTQSVFCDKRPIVCKDGNYVYRNPKDNCNPPSCPDVVYCDASTKCPYGMECYYFVTDKKSYCFKGDPCQTCHVFEECSILESYPLRLGVGTDFSRKFYKSGAYCCVWLTWLISARLGLCLFLSVRAWLL